MAVMRGTGLGKPTRAEMMRSQVIISSTTMFGPGSWQESDRYKKIKLSRGLGFGRFDTPVGRAFFHTGHDGGAQNYTVSFLDKKIGIVLMSNSDNFEGVTEQIVAKVIGDVYTPFDWLGYVPFDPAKPRNIPQKRIPVKIDTHVYERYTGRYLLKLEQEKTIYIKTDNGRLLVSDNGQSWTDLLPLSENRFYVEGDPNEFSFKLDESGGVTHLVIHCAGDFVILCKRMD